jgi:uncharacterized protein YcfJ
MHTPIRHALAIAALALATQASAQVTIYENDGFTGRSFTTQRAVGNLDRYGYNDRASSVLVSSGRWEVCEDAGFSGRCVVLRQGSYPSLRAMGLNDRISSVRAVGRGARVDDNRYAPPPVVTQDFRRRRNERLYQAEVIDVRAVFGPPERRCWIERQQVQQESSGANAPGALIGAVIGGILGHQVGGGTGRDIATAGGAVAGAVIGSKVGRNDGSQTVVQDVQRCVDRPAQGGPAYWDVIYRFRGREHHVQLTRPPGRTVTVNRQGEPRA